MLSAIRRISKLWSYSKQTTKNNNGCARRLSIEPLEDRRMLAQTTGVFVNDVDQAYDGFTLFNPQNVTTTYLINNEGDVVNRWDSQYEPGLMQYLLPDGSLIRAGHPVGGPSPDFNAIGGGGRLEWKSWDNELLWEFRYDSYNHLSHHDIEPVFNEDGSLKSVLMIAWERKTVGQANRAGRDPALRTQEDGEIYPDHIIEVKPILDAPQGQPNFEIVWEWHLWDHLVQDYDNTKRNFGVVANNPQLVDINKLSSGEGQGAAPSLDWTHANGISYNPEMDLIVLSVRKFSEYWVIDHSTTTAEAATHAGGSFGKGGDLLFRWGQPSRYDAGPASDRTMWYQHDATWVLGNDPNSTTDDTILVLDNGWGRPGQDFTATLEIPVPTVVPNPDPNAEYMFVFNDPQYYGPAPNDHVSVYDAPAPRYFAPVISGAQRLPNGNTLSTYGTSGTFVEVNDEGDVVWEYVNRWTSGGPLSKATPVPTNPSPLDANSTFKVRKYGEEYFDFDANPDFNREDLYPDRHDTIGLANPDGWQWILADHFGGSTDGNTVLGWGENAPRNWIPLAGDWDGDGRDSIGLYNPQTNTWFLNGDVLPDGSVEEPFEKIVGPKPHPTWLPVVGDWDGDGADSPGLFSRQTSRWWLNNRTTTDGANDFKTFVMGGPQPSFFRPVAGDFDGDGIDTIGFYNERTNAWRLYNNYNSASGKFENATPVNRDVFKTPGFDTYWQPIVGDWDGDGADSVGLYNPNRTNWYFNNRNAYATPNDEFSYRTPPAPNTWLPLTGNWDGSDGAIPAANNVGTDPLLLAAAPHVNTQFVIQATTHVVSTDPPQPINDSDSTPAALGRNEDAGPAESATDGFSSDEGGGTVFIPLEDDELSLD